MTPGPASQNANGYVSAIEQHLVSAYTGMATSFEGRQETFWHR